MDRKHMEVDEFFRNNVVSTQNIDSHEGVVDITRHFDCPQLVYLQEIALDDGTLLRYEGQQKRPVLIVEREVTHTRYAAMKEFLLKFAEGHADHRHLALKIMIYSETRNHIRHAVSHTCQVYRILALGSQFSQHQEEYLSSPPLTSLVEQAHVGARVMPELQLTRR